MYDNGKLIACNFHRSVIKSDLVQGRTQEGGGADMPFLVNNRPGGGLEGDVGLSGRRPASSHIRIYEAFCSQMSYLEVSKA